MRRVAAVSLGVFVAFAIVSMFDFGASTLFKIPDIETADRVALARAIAGIPATAKAIIALSWFVASLAGAWLTLRIADWSSGAWIVAAVFLAANIYNQVILPHPLWMQIAAVVLPVVAGWLARRVHRKPYPGEPLLG